jgi:succinyl-CoA synthetase beta subunit
VLVNIFGGIMRCDVVAAGIVNAAKEIGIKVPVVVRLEGTNVEEGKRILADSGLNLAVATSLKDAAQKAVNSVK